MSNINPRNVFIVVAGGNTAAERHFEDTIQRNIGVVDAQSPAKLQLTVRLGCGAAPGAADVQVQEVNPHDVAWLSILTGKRDHGYKQATHAAAVAGMTYPTL